MAVESLCPICGATYNLADDMHGKKVKCKKCEHNFTVGGEAAARKRREEEEEAEEHVTTKAGKGKGKKDDDDDRGRKNRRYHDEEKDKADGKKLSEQVQRKGTTESKEKAKTTPIKSIVIGGICLVILLGCCGGGSFGIWYVKKKSNEVVDAVNHPPQNNGGGIGGGGIGGGGIGGGFGGGVVKPPPPKAIASVDEALNGLRSPVEDERKKGAEWLQRAPVDPAQRGDVSRQLEANLSDNNEDVAEAAAKALVPWATKDNVPELIRRVEDQTFGFRAGKLRPHAIAALARLKDARAAPALAARLSDNEFRERAREALIAIGPGGEAAVRGQLTSNKKEVRDAAVAILGTYGVKENFALTQALADLRATDHRRKDAAAATILAQPIDEKRRGEVLQALEAAMQDRSPFGGTEVIRAYAAWGTKENIPTLAKQLDHQNAQARKATIDALVKTLDARAVKPLVERLADRGDRRDVSTAIQTLGADPTLTNVTETEVQSLLETSADRETRVECCKILGAVGTKACLPALMKIDQDTMKIAQQRLLNTAAKNAIDAINRRGK
jgi:predicted Zn finger-like uncharacterized protein